MSNLTREKNGPGYLGEVESCKRLKGGAYTYQFNDGKLKAWLHPTYWDWKAYSKQVNRIRRSAAKINQGESSS